MTDTPEPTRKAVKKGHPPAKVCPTDPLKLVGGISREAEPIALPHRPRHPADIEFCRKVELAEKRLGEDARTGERVFTYAQYRTEVFTALEQLRRSFS